MILLSLPFAILCLTPAARLLVGFSVPEHQPRVGGADREAGNPSPDREVQFVSFLLTMHKQPGNACFRNRASLSSRQARASRRHLIRMRRR